MILTSQEEFGLRCALTVARASTGLEGEEPLTLGQIAASEGMTSAYAGKIMRLLVQEGIVESTRGRSGGYRLSRDASAISVAEVLRATGSKFYEEELCEPNGGSGGLCVHNNDCSIRSLWMGIQSMIDGMLREMSLSQLICDESTMEKNIQALRSEAEAEVSALAGDGQGKMS